MKITPTEVKIQFRNLEMNNLKYSASKAHRQFIIYIHNYDVHISYIYDIYINIYT